MLSYAGGVALAANRQFLWVDRTGKRGGAIGAPLSANNLRVSPDGKRVAFSEAIGSAAADIWIHDIDRDLRTRLTTDSAVDDNPVWSPDGPRFVFHSMRDGASALYEKLSNGATPEQLQP